MSLRDILDEFGITIPINFVPCLDNEEQGVFYVEQDLHNQGKKGLILRIDLPSMLKVSSAIENREVYDGLHYYLNDKGENLVECRIVAEQVRELSEFEKAWQI